MLRVSFRLSNNIQLERKERKETFYFRLYGVRHVVNDHSDSNRRNLMLPHGLLFPISSKGSFICTIPQTG